MPLSSWQDALILNQPSLPLLGPASVRQVSKSATVAGNDPTYDKVTVSTGYGGLLAVYEYRYTSGTPDSMRYCYLHFAPRSWELSRPLIPEPLAEKVQGLEYSRIPSVPATTKDGWVEWEAGDNTITWPSFAVSLDSISGNPAGAFRVRLALDPDLPKDLGNYDPSAWGALDSTATTVFTGDGSTPTGQIATVTIPDGTKAFLLWVESDSTADSSVAVSYQGQIVPTVTTPRWRYWIPDGPTYTNPVQDTTGARVRSIIVDCSSSAPSVTSHQTVRAELNILGNANGQGLSIPSSGRSVFVDAEGFLSLWGASGSLLSTLHLYDGRSRYVDGIFANPSDPTECAVVVDSPVIYVVKGLDDVPFVDRVIYDLPRSTDDWLTGSTDPYRVSHGLLNVGFPDVTGDNPTEPLVFRPMNPAGADRAIGTTSNWYYDPGGNAEMGPGRVIHQYIGEPFVDATDQVVEGLILDYRDPEDLKVRNLTFPIGDVIPNFVPDDYRLDWLISGSFGISANGPLGLALGAMTALTDDPNDTTSVPGTTIYGPNRFSLVVTKVSGPVTGESQGEVIALPAE